MSSQYYSATAYVGTPHRNAVEVTIPLVGPAGPQGPAGEGGGGDLTSPGPIGSVAPNTGAFTTLSATGTATLPHIHGSLAGNLYIHVKNTSGGQLTRGTPVYIVGNVGSTDRVEVAAADFDDATKMPAVGLLEQTLANNGTGDAVIVGELTSVNTGSYSLNQELFVGNNGALTTTRPNSGEVQSVGTVSRVHASTGVIVVNMQARRSPNEAFAAAVTDIELTPNGTTTIITAQLPARGIAFTDGAMNFTVNLPTPNIRQSGLTFSIKRELEGEGGEVFITVVHNAATLVLIELEEAEGSWDFFWDGYEWTWNNTYFLRSTPSRTLLLPQSSGTLALTQQRDDSFRILGSVDQTKRVAFEVDGLSSGTTRTLTVPNVSGTLALTSDFAAPPAIGNTTPAAISGTTGTFTTLTANNGTLTASAPVLDLAQTWNASGTTFTGLNLALTNTASASASSYFNINLDGGEVFSIRRGESNASATLIRCGTSGLTWTARTRTGAGVGVNFSGVVGVGASLQFGTSTGTTGGDLILIRDDAANILALRNGTAAQTFNIYNTFTSATNHERGFLKWSSNVFQIGTEKGSGGGTARALEFQTDGVTRFSISDAGAVRVVGALRVGANFNVSPLVVQHGDGVEAFRCQYNATFDFGGRLFQMGAGGTGGTIQIHTDGDNLMALRRGANAQNLRIYNTVSGTNNVNFERANFRWASSEFIIDAEFGGTGTALRGIKIGSATSSLLGFYGVTPVDQPATVADPAGGGTIDTEARTAINDIIDRLQELGLIA
jgi:hypothetical protein